MNGEIIYLKKEGEIKIFYNSYNFFDEQLINNMRRIIKIIRKKFSKED